MHIGILTLHIHLPGSNSLKQKRSRLKPLLARLQRDYNISVSEINFQDAWQEAVIACAFVSNDNGHTQRYLQKISNWVNNSWPDVNVIEEHIEIIP
ncbi:MAG: DUF503 domain-containing protein [Chloroflexota bacterium]|nr:DUF503 domain-containing protein [Chloroflexota bacterium]